VSAIENGEKRTLEEILRHKIGTLFRKYRPRRPFPGRPAFPPELKWAKSVAREAREKYVELRKHLPPDEFLRLHGQMETILTAADMHNDIEVIRYFDQFKPWTLPSNLPPPPPLKPIEEQI